MTYNNHTIKRAYGCDGRLVWRKQGGEGYENQYLTVIPRGDGTMYWFGMSFGTRCYYSMDSGLTWSKLDETINVSEGQKIMLKKEWYEDKYKIALPSGQLKLTTNYDIEGNIMSMVYSDDFYEKTDLSGKDRAFTSFLKPNMVRIEGELMPVVYGPVNAENLVLPATTLSSGCYSNMFQGCEMLEKAPKELPAMELTPACYSEMFENCSNLTKAPFLPANILVGVDTSIDSGCYNHMFLGCRKLNEITCLATNQETSSLPANYLMHHWVAGVAETGTFYKYPGSRWRVSDKNGNSIPVGWTVKDYNPQPTFTGKWLATYNSGRSVSGECDSTSAITKYEVSTDSLLQIEIGECVTNICGGAFEYSSYLTGVTVGNNVKIIGDVAFGYCNNLLSVDLPATMTNIGEAAFTSCKKLSAITIPYGVTSIERQTFNECEKLQSVDIPDSVASINFRAFFWCLSLVSVKIGSGVTSIAESAFQGCTGLTSITVLATTPPTLGGTPFANTGNAPIYVPASSVELYKNQWAGYASRIQPIQ